MKISFPSALAIGPILALALLPPSLSAEPVSLKRVVELALSHATGAAIAAADEERAAASYRELRGSYVPQITTGAGLGYSYGFPLSLEGSAPALFNINTQSAVLNPALREFLRAARVETNVAALRSKDERSLLIQDAAQSYTELAMWEQRLGKLQEFESNGQKLQAAVAERVREGIDSEMDGDKARLAMARIRLRLAQAQGAADVLREHLSKLTGLPALGLETDPDSIPQPPAPPQDEAAAKDAAASTPSVEAAVEHARAQYLRAKAEHRSLLPSFDLAGQYALLSKFNNFQEYEIPEKECSTSLGTFLCPTGGFRQNNATLGVSIRFPLFNTAQRSRAQAADADALKASKQAEAAKNQASEETLRLQRSVTQLEAQHEVAQLEYQIAEKSLAAVETRIDTGAANLHDLDDARTQANEHFLAFQDVTFELQRAEMALMRATGELEKWALGPR
jgi:outer membrane protein TolC